MAKPKRHGAKATINITPEMKRRIEYLTTRLDRERGASHSEAYVLRELLHRGLDAMGVPLEIEGKKEDSK